MDQNDLLAIGRFADITGLSVHTLRHYDDVGLLAPAEVDASSGYRRYSRNQIGLARLIKALRRVELPVDDVRAVLADPASPHTTNTLIRHRDRLVAQHAQMSHQIDDVDEFIKRGIFMSRKPVYSGKVRDIYDAGDDKFLFVASDRLSVFDVVLNEPVPDKGRILTGMTHYWLGELADIAPNHMITCDPAEIAAAGVEVEPDDAGRAMLVKKADMLLVECIVRGYITGSAWSEYKKSGTMNGTPLPAGIQESEQLPEPVFTPSTKAELGDHDINISFDEAANIIGKENAERARDLSLAAYVRASEQAAERGIIIADTKFELGWIDGELALCDEVLTPDSSRFWPIDEWKPGVTPPSFDKQPVRDLLAATGWDKSPPAPPITDDVVVATRSRYIEAYEIITGLKFSDWYGVK
ncbi:MAG: phosphoribosylaminoimidazole-succinocarboxamide synthase [Actinomycetota bacterium]